MRRWMFVLVCLLLATPGFAQGVVNPTVVAFAPSADHEGTFLDGTPKVVGYTLELYQRGATAPFHTIDLGKPAPTDGTCTVSFADSFAAWPFPQTGEKVYEARVTAMNPYGAGRSDPSNPFERGYAPASPSNVTVRQLPGQAGF